MKTLGLSFLIYLLFLLVMVSPGATAQSVTNDWAAFAGEALAKNFAIHQRYGGQALRDQTMAGESKDKPGHGVTQQMQRGTKKEREGNIQIINAGIGGNTSKDLLERINEDVVVQKPDLVLIMVGTNDMVNSGKMVKYEAYERTLLKIIEILTEEKMGVILLSPPPVDTVYLFERHRREAFNELPNQKLESVRNMLYHITIEKDLHFIDIYNAFKKRGLPKHNIDEFIKNPKNCGKRDGVHPTPKGYQLIAETIFDYLEINHLIKPDLKIVCFGDSITKGVRVEGSGTSNGDTYPAALLRLIENSVAAKE